MENYFNTGKKELCNGCGTCALRCPKSAIEMVEDGEGFLYPHINKEKCINCGLCEKVCSNFNKSEQESVAYIAINNNDKELKNASSGGMFYILAKYVIENKGVVFGVTYDEDLNVIHKYAETLEDCKQFCGSKYVRSDLKNTYKEAEKFLKDGRVVLYTGTACQISGLKSYLGKEYDNLILCDILCHANPSPKVFKLYKENLEKKYSKKVKDIRFRSKENGWRNQTPIIVFNDGNKIEENTFFNAFVKEMINRQSCYSCMFASKSRITDFTIADFWGIEKVKPNLDSTKGVSLLTVNSEKGKKLLNLFKDNTSILEKIDIDLAAEYNHFTNVQVHKNRDKFFEGIENASINNDNIIYVMNKYTKVSIFRKMLRKGKRIINNIIKNKVSYGSK